MVDMAMEGHLSDRELRKYSSGATAPLTLARTPIAMTTAK
jgi:hypothetical protein